jgi:hypothetical protein
MGIAYFFVALLRKAYVDKNRTVAIMCLFAFKERSLNSNPMFSFNPKSSIIIMVFINIKYS